MGIEPRPTPGSFLFPRAFAALVRDAGARGDVSVDGETRRLLVASAPDTLPFRLALPALFPAVADPAALVAALPAFLDSAPDCLLVLLRAESAALAVFHGREPVRHRVLCRYSVRRKQGVAQATYLRRKGKSRAGSRLRLREGRLLLEDTAATLFEWEDELETLPLLFLGCPVRLRPELFAVDGGLPFAADEARLVPVTVPYGEPRYRELLRVRGLLAAARVLD